MSWNNWSYTKRKQKEMAKKSAAYQQVLENDSYEYTQFSKPQQNSTQWQEERARDRRMKIITVVMLSLMSMVFVAIIAYFITYGA